APTTARRLVAMPARVSTLLLGARVFHTLGPCRNIFGEPPRQTDTLLLRRNLRQPFARSIDARRYRGGQPKAEASAPGRLRLARPVAFQGALGTSTGRRTKPPLPQSARPSPRAIITPPTAHSPLTPSGPGSPHPPHR